VRFSLGALEFVFIGIWASEVRGKGKGELRFEVLTAVKMSVVIFWIVTLCSL
jgi:hypothetical protein